MAHTKKLQYRKIVSALAMNPSAFGRKAKARLEVTLHGKG